MTNELSGEGKPLPSYQELLDESLEMTFPASDPIAVSACTRTGAKRPSYQYLLDEAVEETFPASDPIAAYGCAAERNEVDWSLECDGDTPAV